MGNDKFKSNGSSRRGRKGRSRGSHSADNKPLKQPQRGLGVAQLEKIRLHNQMFEQEEEVRMQYGAMQTSMEDAPSSSSSLFGYPSCQSPIPSYGFPPYIMMRIGVGEPQSCDQSRLNPRQLFPDSHSYASPGVPTTTTDFLDSLEDKGQSARRDLTLNMKGSSRQNSGSSDHTQYLDLELRL